LNDYQNHSKEVFKLLPDEYGIDEVYWNHQTNDNEIIFSFSWNQIKIGYSDNYLNENEISLLENNEILEKLQVLQNSISDKIRSKYKENFNFIKINHKTNIITTKKFSKKKIQNNLNKNSIDIIRILSRDSPYLPTRIREFLPENGPLIIRHKEIEEKATQKTSLSLEDDDQLIDDNQDDE